MNRVILFLTLFAFIQPSFLFCFVFYRKPHQKFEIKNKITQFTAIHSIRIYLIRYEEVTQKKTSQPHQADRTIDIYIEN